MTTLADRILSLSDPDSCRILATYASHQPGYRDSALTPELEQALRSDPALSAESSGEGDLARAALLLLADGSEHRAVLDALVGGPPPQRYAVLETAAVISAVLFALQTHVKIERDKDGRWSFRIEKKPTDNGLLKSLMQKLLGMMSE